MGADSTAMLLGWHQRGLQRPDAILFADTGSEKPQTYAYLPTINAWLERVGYPSVTVVKNASPIAGDKSLHEECLRKSVLPSLAYGGHSCSIKWKVDPQLKWVREHFGWTQGRKQRGATERPEGTFAHGPDIVKLVGYDAGPKDARRVSNATDKWPPGHINRYPLIEWGWDRAACLQAIISADLPGWNPAYLHADLVTFSRLEWIERGGVPCKSSCFMCPASQKAEIAMLKDCRSPQLDVALEMERRAVARGLRTVKGLGRRFSWTEIISVPVLA
jgi:hypothetical protein